MSRAHLIYPLERILANKLDSLKEDRYNGKIILRYHNIRKLNLALATQIRELVALQIASRLLEKRFEKTCKIDVEEMVGKIHDMKNKDSTKNRNLKIIKAFYRWLKEYPKNQYPPIVNWIELKRLPITPYTADDMVSESEIIRISNYTLNLRDRAIIQNKVDGACRIDELLTSRIGEIKFTKNGAEIKCDGKTGNLQPIILSWSAGILAQWLNVHPFKDNPDAPIYCAFDHTKPRYLSYHGASKMFKNTCIRAGVKRRMWLHLLKYVGCTEDARRGMPDGLRKFKHHHSMNSNMDAVYVHFAHGDIPDIQRFTMKKLGGNAGVVSEKKEKSVVISCKRCLFGNVIGAKYCNRCAFCLDDVNNNNEKKSLIKTKTEEIIGKLLDDPAKIEKLSKILNSL